MIDWRVLSETGRLREVLVCPPDHYRWLPTNSISRRTLAEGRQGAAPAHLAAQHGELCAALTQAGVLVRRIAPEPHLPYMAYTRDGAVVTHRGPVLCQLERPQRRGEYAPLLDFFAGAGAAFWRKSSAGTLEGGDVHVLRDGLAVIGCSGDGAAGGRTDEAGAAQLADWLRTEGWEVRIEPFAEHFLHLDVLFCMAAPGLALACADVLGEDFVGWLAGRGVRCVPVSYRDAMRLGCNVLALGDGRVVSARESRAVNAALRAEGLAVLDPALDLFTSGGGGPHCLTCPLSRDPE